MEKVFPGDPFSNIDAQDWNTIVSAGKRYSNSRINKIGPRSSTTRNPDTINVVAAVDFDMFAAIELGPPTFIPSSVESADFISGPTLNGLAPTSNVKPWGITAEPIALGFAGQVWVGGVVPAAVDDLVKVGDFVAPKSGDKILHTCPSGLAKVIWVNDVSTSFDEAGVTFDSATKTFDNGSYSPRAAVIQFGFQAAPRLSSTTSAGLPTGGGTLSDGTTAKPIGTAIIGSKTVLVLAMACEWRCVEVC